MNWYKKVIKVVAKDQAIIAVYTITVLSATLAWRYGLHHTFEWLNINPISAPELFERVIYSALVFVTLGALLYRVGFYKLLYEIIVNELGDRWVYRKVKAIIWGILMLIMYFWIVPAVVDILNFVISLLFNLLNFTIYLFPPVGCAVIITGLSSMLFMNRGKT